MPQPSSQATKGQLAAHATATAESCSAAWGPLATVDLGRCPPGPRAWSWSRSGSRRRRRRTCGQDALAQLPHRDHSEWHGAKRDTQRPARRRPSPPGPRGVGGPWLGLAGECARACAAGSLSCSQETGGQAGLSVCSRHGIPKTASVRSSMSDGRTGRRSTRYSRRGGVSYPPLRNSSC